MRVPLCLALAALLGAGCGPGPSTCQPSAQTDTTCDGVDDDCDGRADDDLVAAATTCGVGACARTGTSSCTSGKPSTGCTPGAPLDATDATCDGVDDDCDGQVDEDFTPAATSCGLGPCARAGQSTCTAGTPGDTCVAGQPAAATDSSCNGVDDDCSGQVDEDFVPATTNCGVGACARTGASSCVDGGTLDSCVAGQPPASTDATCDGIDDDCDGVRDDEYVGTATTCGSAPGPCVGTGTSICPNGAVLPGCTCNAIGSAANPATSCRDILEHGGPPDSGIYTLRQAPAAAYTAYCDLQADDGGWTGIFVGANGSPNVFDHFDQGYYAGTFTNPASQYLQRAPATVNDGFGEVGVSCGGAFVAAPMTERAADYLLRGVQQSWLTLTSRVVKGGVANVPASLYTGTSSAPGFIFSYNQSGGGNTFAASFGPANTYDGCNGTIDTTSIARVFYREAAKPVAKNLVADARPTCRDVIRAGASAGTGYYWLNPGGGTPVLHHCDMTTDTGGWTTLLAGLNGSVNSFAHLDDSPFTEVCTDPGRRCVRRAPALLADAAGEVAASCGGVTVAFALTEKLRAHLLSGAQNGWLNVTPRVLTGSVTNVPDTVFTGTGAVDKGFIVSRNSAGGSLAFASSYAPNANFDYCRGVLDQASLWRLSFREVDPEPIRNAVGTAMTNCYALRAAGNTLDGRYYITEGAGSPYLARCDMTTDGGGWTWVFAGRSGAVNVFDHFDSPVYLGLCPDPASRCVRRAGPSLTNVASDLLVQCGGAAVKLGVTNPVRSYLTTGASATWSPIAPTVVRGTVTNLPNTFFSGNGTNRGFVLSKDSLGGASVFAASFDSSTAYDFCNNVADAVSLFSVGYRQLPAAPTRNLQANARFSCRAVLDAGESAGDGLYWVTEGGTAHLAYCDMTTGSGGWTAMFSGRNGSPHVFDAYDTGYYTGVCTDPTTRCQRRAPSALTGAGGKLAVECGGAMVEFPATAATAAYFTAGTVGNWQALVPTVLAGTVANVPNGVFTGDPSNRGFMFARNQTAGTSAFGGSYANATWDFCNGVADFSSILRVYYREGP